MLMHYCTARVNLSGQGFHIVQFEEADAVSWPELQVLMALHGDENILDIKPISVAHATPNQEKARLAAKYSFAVVEHTFPGRMFRMEMLMPGHDTELPRHQGDGIEHGNGDDEDDGEDEVLGRDPPTAVPVFKPSKHQRPAPNAPAPTPE